MTTRGRRGRSAPTSAAAEVAAGLAAVALLTGCTPTGEGEAGMGIPRQPPDAPVAGPRDEIRGTVRVETDGCVMLEAGSGERRWIVWPADQEDDRGHPVLDGRVVADGDVLAGTGAQVPADALPGWDEGVSHLVTYATFCSADRTRVVVLDAVVRD